MKPIKILICLSSVLAVVAVIQSAHARTVFRVDDDDSTLPPRDADYRKDRNTYKSPVPNRPIPNYSLTGLMGPYPAGEFFIQFIEGTKSFKIEILSDVNYGGEEFKTAEEASLKVKSLSKTLEDARVTKTSVWLFRNYGHIVITPVLGPFAPEEVSIKTVAGGKSLELFVHSTESCGAENFQLVEEASWRVQALRETLADATESRKTVMLKHVNGQIVIVKN